MPLNDANFHNNIKKGWIPFLENRGNCMVCRVKVRKGM